MPLDKKNCFILQTSQETQLEAVQSLRLTLTVFTNLFSFFLEVMIANLQFYSCNVVVKPLGVHMKRQSLSRIQLKVIL